MKDEAWALGLGPELITPITHTFIPILPPTEGPFTPHFPVRPPPPALPMAQSEKLAGLAKGPLVSTGPQPLLAKEPIAHHSHPKMGIE